MDSNLIQDILKERDLKLAFFQSQFGSKQQSKQRASSKRRQESLLEKILDLPAPKLALLLAAVKKGELG